MGYISKYQLFSLATIATIGGTTIFCMASSAKNDAWLAIFLSFLIATVFVWFFVKLQNLYPDKNYIEIISETLGKILGIPLSLLYLMHFIYQCSRSYRDYTEFISATFLENTPRMVIMMTSMLLMCYIVYLGYETLTRTAEILNPSLSFFLSASTF